MAKVFIEETTLSAIGDAIRTKTETTELINPADMAKKIEGISVGSAAVVEPLSITANGTYNAPEGIDGYTPITVNVPQEGGPPPEALKLTGYCQYRFAYGGWDWFVKQYGNQITTENIFTVNNMFEKSNVEDIPFDINISIQASFDNMFNDCKKLKNLPNIINSTPTSITQLFRNCHNLREIPEDYCDTWDWSYIESLTSAYLGNMSAMFSGCYSLRKIPQELINHINPNAAYTINIAYGGFTDCFVLDEINDLIIPNKAVFTSNTFSSTFANCYRLKRFTFKKNEDGTPIIVQWKSQVIDLSSYAGYVRFVSYITDYNGGITADTKITDDATYQALKDNPDNWTANINYSRYNKISAIETINSLPDTSAYLATAGGTNTIKFKGAAGALTDGGAINTMTEEEIAVAAAKGWTVAFV